MAGEIYDISVVALRALFLIAGPIVIALALAGLLVSFLQSAMLIDEPAIGHAVRLLALCTVLYLLFQPFSDTMISLAQAALGR